MSNHCHINATSGKTPQPLSDHFRRSHGRFAQNYNRRHKRTGAFFNGRPKTKPIENERHRIRAFLYSDINPVRANLIRHPTDIRYRNFSSCRHYAFGERTEFSDMLTPPAWYLRLGKTRKQRQAKYRSLLDKYMIESGLKRDPAISDAQFIGSAEWIEQMKSGVRALQGKTPSNHPDPSTPIDTS
jgi:putative transposase